MTNYHSPFEAEKFYHVYNRANSNQDKLFIEHSNYRYFIDLFKHHTNGFLKLYAYCLIPNHFHFLIKIEHLDAVKQSLKAKMKWQSYHDVDINLIISEMFRRFFVAYAKAFNKKYERRGSLFQKDFKRLQVEENDYFESIVFYIHTNPLKHLVTLDFRTYSYSSYSLIIDADSSLIAAEEILIYFGGVEKFKQFHENFLHRNTISNRNSIS